MLDVHSFPVVCLLIETVTLR
uniref:Uncharacterized protein n=1 Tax=Rhizophora mucronata TaxID=61149 RepID=A0A2P2QSJ9_RHIMU